MLHEESSFKGLKDFNIYYQKWLPSADVKAVLLISHGFAEHSSRYNNVVNYFVPKEYAVYALDHRGHGRSDGERVQTDDFYDYVKDLRTFFNLARREIPNGKVFLIGHSMGSVIALLYTVEYQQDLDGLITSGGGMAKPGDPPMPEWPAGKPLLTAMLSRDRAVIEAYEDDPLVYHGPVPEGMPLFSTMGKLPEIVPQISIPVLIMAGNGGPDGARSQVLYEYIGSRDKTLKLYEGLLHEIFNEPEYHQVMSDMENWLDARL
jgi:lysophospholipase